MSSPLFDAWSGRDRVDASEAFRDPSFAPWSVEVRPGDPVPVSFRRAAGLSIPAGDLDALHGGRSALAEVRLGWLRECERLLVEGLRGAGFDPDGLLSGDIECHSVMSPGGDRWCWVVSGDRSVLVAQLPACPLVAYRAGVDARLREGLVSGPW